MDSAQFQQVGELFEKLRSLDPEERAASLESHDVSAGVRRKVEALLAHHDKPATLLDEPSLEGTSLAGPSRLTPSQMLARDTAGDFQPPGHDATEPGARSPAWPDRIGKFRILGVCGHGGMGTVFTAEQDHPQRRVALKMIRSDLISDAMLKRFERETALLGRLQHPGIAQVYEAGWLDTDSGRRPFFSMELIEGVSLLEHADKHALDTSERLELFLSVCASVQHAHEQGVIHCDLKPDNVLVVGRRKTSTGIGEVWQTKILDFGIARATDADAQRTTRLTDSRKLVGTLPYMSPEQVSGDISRLDLRSDVYALGVLCFELLTGRLPHDLENRSVPESVRIISEDDPTSLATIRPMLRGDVDTIVHTALEKDAGRRYTSVAALAADVRSYLDDHPISARPPSTFYQVRKFTRRHRALVGGTLTTLLVFIIGAIVATIQAHRATVNARTATQMKQDAMAQAYRAGVSAADASIETSPEDAARHLASTPEELRNWEWHHLATRRSPLAAYAVPDPGEDRAPSDGAFAGDGAVLFTYADGSSVHIVDIKTHETRHLADAPSSLDFLTMSADASMVAGATQDYSWFGVWSLADGELMMQGVASDELPLDRSWPRMTFSADGRRLAFARPGHGFRVVDVPSNQPVCNIDLDSKAMSFGLDASGRRLAVNTAIQTKKLRLYQVDNLENPQPSLGPIGAYSTAPPEFSNDGQRLATARHEIELRDAGTLAVLETLHGHRHPVIALAFSQDDRQLASMSHMQLHLWDLDKRLPPKVLSAFGPGFANARPFGNRLRFNSDGTVLLATTGKGARLWDLDQDGARVLRGHSSYIYHAVYNPDGSLIASAGWDQSVRIWDPLTGESLRTLHFEAQQAGGLAFSEDGTQLVAIGYSPRRQARTHGRTAYLWDTATGLEVARPVEEATELYQLVGRNGARRSARGHTQNTMTSLDGRLCIKGTRDSIMVTETATDEVVMVLETPRQAHATAVGISPDGHWIATGHRGKGDDPLDSPALVRIWDARTGALHTELGGHDGRVYSVCFSPDGSRIASGGTDGVVRVWDTERAHLLLTLRGHDSYVHSVVFSPDGSQILTGSGDHTLRIWDTVTAADRREEAERAAALREQMRPRVMGLLEQLDDPAAVAASIRRDATFDETERRAALRVLLQREAPPDEH